MQYYSMLGFGTIDNVRGDNYGQNTKEAILL